MHENHEQMGSLWTPISSCALLLFLCRFPLVPSQIPCVSHYRPPRFHTSWHIETVRNVDVDVWLRGRHFLDTIALAISRHQKGQQDMVLGSDSGSDSASFPDPSLTLAPQSYPGIPALP